MFKEIIIRMKKGYKTMKFPKGIPPTMPDRFLGIPIISTEKCPDDCKNCVEACPTNAISLNGDISIDMGKCIFCLDCIKSCQHERITFSKDYRMAVRNRNDLIISVDQKAVRLATELQGKMRKLFGRSLKIRVVSAGGCNGCEADINVLGTIGWDV